MSEDLSNFSMRDLFRIETENQSTVLTEGLLALERDPKAAEMLESLMRAAHSIKGAARIISLDEAVRIAHAMEDCFVAAQNDQIQLGAKQMDVLLRGVDMLTQISNIEENDTDSWFASHKAEIDTLVVDLSSIIQGKQADAEISKKSASPNKQPAPELESDQGSKPSVESRPETGGGEKERVLRLSSQHLDRLLALTSELQVELQWLSPFSDSMLRLRRRLIELEKMLLDSELSNATVSSGKDRLIDIQGKAKACREMLMEQMVEMDMHTRSLDTLSQRLQHQTISSRMRPFSSGVPGYKRMVRDLSRQLGKQVRLDITGLDTSVDRDILEKIEAPLNHLIRNAIDHGIETADERRELGKPEEGVIHLEAVHQAGMLHITVSDDGRGLNMDALREKIVTRGHATRDMVSKMTETELMAFLFLPKFTMKESVSEISGRGVGLDVVATMIRDVRGTLRSSTHDHGGMRFELRLPLTLSVIRSLLVEINKEPYAFPLAHIERTLKCSMDEIEHVEGRQYVSIDDQQIGLVSIREVLGLPPEPASSKPCSIIILGNIELRYGLIVDRFLGERDLVEKVLNPMLGKVKDISAAALTADGSPLLIFDVNDLLKSIDKLVKQGKLGRTGARGKSDADKQGKRVLVVDDSITVREVERKLLASKGYRVDVAVDGVDGWNSVRMNRYDLVITDVDMPHMDGIELVRQIRADSKLRDIPVIIVSYKESDEDRMRGLEAGADAYLTKSSFHDETLLNSVDSLIGSA